MTAHATSAGTRLPALTGRLFTDDDFDFNARFAISKASQGVFDLGVAVSTLGRIADGDPESWLREWTATADRLQRQAVASDQAGQYQTAAWLYLGAAEAYARAMAFIDGLLDDSALVPTFTRHRACWEAFINASHGTNVRFDIAYQDTTLPGYLFRPDSSGAARPTLVITNGSDGPLSGLWAEGIKAGLERGWNVFVFDGPGQQSLLFERGIPFRHDWEQVLTPVVDALLTRPDVDGKRLLASALSQGGYWLPRALAFEHRFVAAVVDDGVWDVARVWYANLPEPLVDLLEAGERDRFNQTMAAAPADPVRNRGFRFRARPYGTFETPYDLFRAVGRYRLADVAGGIRTPMLICDPDDEAWFTGQPRELYDALCCEKELVQFFREDGANYHCEPWARGLVAARMCDFFQKHLELVVD
ncbi:MAG TPA: hypothetical protein VHX38_30720 [Pseudonocardiaceae bacterium]|jgi:hypothetical protein|nr:hypothetical protein [Pseudonocardiaceae bacterium]